MDADHLTAHTSIRTPTAHSSISTRNTPHGCLLAHRMVSDKLLTIGTPSDNNTSIEKTRPPHGWLIVPSMPDYRLMDICWLMGWYLISS